MKPVGALAGAFVRTTMREGNSLFWFWLFPLLLLALLNGIFGRVQRGEFNLAVAVVNGDPGPLGSELVQVLKQPGLPLRLHALLSEGSVGDPLRVGQKKVEEGEWHAVLHIPAGFSAQLLRGDQVQVEIFYRRGEAGSSTAASILAEVVEEFGRGVLLRSGLVRQPVMTTVYTLGGEARSLRYGEFVLPGIMLMALFILGLFSVPDVAVLAKETGVLRRYFATPLSGGQYLLGFALGMGVAGVAQIAVLWAVGRFAFGVDLPLLRPASLAFLFLGFATSIGLGFFVSALARNYQTAMALANLLNLPLQFLGGLYFPVTSLPGAVRVLMAINPLTHLAEGWRAVLGVSTSAFPLWINAFVPLLWFGGSVLLAVRRITFLEGR